MEILVDVFYYDHILSVIIELYQKEEELATIVPYLKIATALSRKFRNDKIILDKQLYIKEVYVRVLQIARQYFLKIKADDKMLIKAFVFIRAVLDEIPVVSTDPNFQAIKVAALSIYKLTKDKKDLCDEKRTEMQKWDLYVNSLQEDLPKGSDATLDALSTECTYEKMMEYLYKIKFENPVLKKFVDYVKNGIDKESKKITSGEILPGEKIKW